MLRQRIITAVMLAVAFFAALFTLSPLPFAIVLLLAFTTAAFEWGKLTGSGTGAAVALAIFVVIAGMLMLQLAGFERVRGFPFLPVVVLCGAAALFWILAAPLWLKAGWNTQRPAPMFGIGLVLLLALWIAMVQLHARSPWLLLGVMLVVWLADTAAYFAGRRFGRTKLAPVISPKKSWEGVYGAFAAVLLYAVLVVVFSPLAGQPFAIRVATVVAAVLLVPLSVLGDLFESWMKRQNGVKDSGRTLPGHGGVLDRIDALIPVLPIATLATLFAAPVS